jgi:hypothetical protein
MSVKFKAIRPAGLKKEVFEQAFDQASEDLAQKIQYSFREATDFFRDKPVFTSKIEGTRRSRTITVTTDQLGFHYYDLGNGGPTRIIRPVKSSVLHWINRSGKDVFAKWVHGYKGFEVSKKIGEFWDKKVVKHFEFYLKQAVKNSGHAMK